MGFNSGFKGLNYQGKVYPRTGHEGLEGDYRYTLYTLVGGVGDGW